MWGLFSKVRSSHNSIQPPQMEINPSKTAWDWQCNNNNIKKINSRAHFHPILCSWPYSPWAAFCHLLFRPWKPATLSLRAHSAMKLCHSISASSFRHENLPLYLCELIPPWKPATLSLIAHSAMKTCHPISDSSFRHETLPLYLWELISPWKPTTLSLIAHSAMKTCHTISGSSFRHETLPLYLWELISPWKPATLSLGAHSAMHSVFSSPTDKRLTSRSL